MNHNENIQFLHRIRFELAKRDEKLIDTLISNIEESSLYFSVSWIDSNIAHELLTISMSNTIENITQSIDCILEKIIHEYNPYSFWDKLKPLVKDNGDNDYASVHDDYSVLENNFI